ncbi:MAG: N-acetylmannosamine-6-phosphate 2-epimerase [Candidatus Gastranaerophilales bacterium]|nr:N-acetylmannosamine-6-phosphate 2-epimerase [Candidatus Gastranaerophilales bacterium]
MDILSNIKNELIVSIQAMPNEPLYNVVCINGMAKSIVELGGANVLRLAGARDINNIKTLYPDLIVIGITKPEIIPDNYKELVYITPTISDCKKVIDAGADIVAFDGTTRKRPNGESLIDLIRYIKSQGKLAMADIATFEEAQIAAEFGADIVSTTLSGYTLETQGNPDTPDFELVKRIKQNLDIFTILEGKVWEKNDIALAFEAGADAVVVGSAITRPQLIFKRLNEGKIHE